MTVKKEKKWRVSLDSKRRYQQQGSCAKDCYFYRNYANFIVGSQFGEVFHPKTRLISDFVFSFQFHRTTTCTTTHIMEAPLDNRTAPAFGAGLVGMMWLLELAPLPWWSLVVGFSTLGTAARWNLEPFVNWRISPLRMRQGWPEAF